jgi:hypothetical protein
MEVEAQVAVASVQGPGADSPGVAEPGDREPRPFAASGPGARAAGTRRSSGAGGRSRIPPGPGRGHARERAARTGGGRGRCRVRAVLASGQCSRQPLTSVAWLARPPAKTCRQAAVTLRWMPGRRPRTAAWQCGGKLESRHRAGLPGPRAELAGLFAEPADADGAAVGAVRRGSCRFRPWLAGLKRTWCSVWRRTWRGWP